MGLRVIDMRVVSVPVTVHVIELNLDNLGARVGCLSTPELERASRFAFAVDRFRFLSAHVATRLVLAHCLGTAPEAIAFEQGRCGKPYLSGAARNLRFNLSHSGGRGLLALADAADVGVDIEQQRELDPLQLAAYAFSIAERKALLMLEPAGRAEAFYLGWTRKESFIKARGDGLSFPLSGFDVSLERAPAQALLGCDAVPGETARWTMCNLAVEPGYAAALTAEGSRVDVVTWSNADAFLSFDFQQNFRQIVDR